MDKDKCIVLIRSKEIQSDSRASKYITYFENKKHKYKIIEWDRRGDSKNDNGSIKYPVLAQYGVGGFAAAKGRIGWMKFVFDTLKKMDDNIVIHACDLDCVYPAILYKKFFNPNVTVIFDVFDWFSDTLYDANKLLKLAFNYMERVSVKYSDHIIICEKERIKQIPFKIENKYSILPNIPSFDNKTFLKEDKDLKFNNNKLTLSYVGSLEEHRCLDNIIEGAIKGYFNLLIAGYGQKRLEDKLNCKSDYIKFFGKVPYKTGLNIMYNSDIVYAMYSPQNPNHIFAAPNKYYEVMFLGKPIITSSGIYLSEKVKRNNIGFAIDEGFDSLISLISKADKNNIKEYGQNSKNLWNVYKDYFEHYMDDIYCSLIYK